MTFVKVDKPIHRRAGDRLDLRFFGHDRLDFLEIQSQGFDFDLSIVESLDHVSDDFPLHFQRVTVKIFGVFGPIWQIIPRGFHDFGAAHQLEVGFEKMGQNGVNIGRSFGFGEQGNLRRYGRPFLETLVPFRQNEFHARGLDSFEGPTWVGTGHPRWTRV